MLWAEALVVPEGGSRRHGRGFPCSDRFICSDGYSGPAPKAPELICDFCFFLFLSSSELPIYFFSLNSSFFTQKKMEKVENFIQKLRNFQHFYSNFVDSRGFGSRQSVPERDLLEFIVFY